MNPSPLSLALPTELEVWLVLGYVAVVLLGARVVEALARMHFTRARRYAEQGFKYVPDEDHYQCPQGERLPLHERDPVQRLAVYRAPAASCNACPLKAACTPHDEGRHLYRPLATWAETDIGRFHQRLSAVMFTIAGLLSFAVLLRWGRHPGGGWLLIALLGSFALLARDFRKLWYGPPSAPGGETSPE